MLDPVSRVEARIRAIQSLIGEQDRTNEESGRPASVRSAQDAMHGIGGEQSGFAVIGGESGPPRTAHSAREGSQRAPRTDFVPLIAEAAQRTGLSADLIGAVIGAESGYRPGAVSPVGAMGLMQLMPGTARGLGVTDPFDPRQNVMAGSEYLRTQLTRFGTVEKALAAYNAGPGAVERYGGVPPFRETQEYVRRVMDALRLDPARAGGGPAMAPTTQGSVLDESR